MPAYNDKNEELPLDVLILVRFDFSSKIFHSIGVLYLFQMGDWVNPKN